MFSNNKILAALYFVAFVGCLLTFISGRGWGYLAAAILWLVLGVYLLIKKNDDL